MNIIPKNQSDAFLLYWTNRKVEIRLTKLNVDSVTIEKDRPIVDNEKFKDQSSDMKKKFNIQIPSRLAERVEAYASANNTTITGVLIEALDTFLRDQQNK